MQAAGDEFLAGARLAVDQHVGGAAGQAGDHRAQALHAGVVADQACRQLLAPGQLRQLRAQFAHFEAQAAFFQRATDDADQMIGRKRFLDEIVRAVFHCLHGHRHVAVAGDQHHRQFGVDGQQLAHEAHAIDARQADVADHDAAEIGVDQGPRGLGAVGAERRDPFELQRLLAAQADVGIVLDDQHLERLRIGHAHFVVSSHSSPSSGATGSSRVNSAPPSGWLAPASVPP